jgi:hypothetical protein
VAVGFRRRWRNKGLILSYMRAVGLSAAKASSEAQAEGDTFRRDYYQGVLIAVQECGKRGQKEKSWDYSTGLGLGYNKGWGLLQLAASAIEAGVGVPKFVLPPLDDEDRPQT